MKHFVSIRIASLFDKILGAGLIKSVYIHSYISHHINEHVMFNDVMMSNY